MRRAAGLVTVAAAVALAGCTGVPLSSAPQTVGSVRLGQQSPGQSITPSPNASPRELVSEFLEANAADPGRSARLFLTKQASSGWRTDTATIVTDLVPGTYSPRTRTVTVVGRSFGTLNAAGIYKPALDGDGTGGERQTFQFEVARVDGHYRINQLDPGLLLTDQQFADNYTRHSLYFYDEARQYLVPDPRYSDLDDTVLLSNWLLAQLAAGPRPELQNAVTSNFPAQGDATNNKITPGTPTKVEVPGAGQLDGQARRRLATQLSQTLSDPLAGGSMTITDGHTPITVPDVGTTFSPSTFASAATRPTPAPTLYYLSSGRVYDQDARRLPGPLGRGTDFLTSIAVGGPVGSGTPAVAAVEGSGAQRRLLVGNQIVGLRPTTLRGALTRPAFAPGLREVWIGSGSRIYRVLIDGTTGRVSPVPILQAPAAAPILALRLSPDGARVALVLGRGPGQTGGQLVIGSVERTPGQVRIDQLTPISPQLTSITDVAWLNSVRLFAIGRLTRSSDPLTFDTGVDGSDWTAHPLGLSTAADSVTVTAGASAWVSAGGFVWRQGIGQWVAPTGGQTPGTNPIYVE